jgi:hypothetical protein
VRVSHATAERRELREAGDTRATAPAELAAR